MGLYCPLIEKELGAKECPVRCQYRRTNGSCAHNELAYDDELTPEEVAVALQVSEKDVIADSRKAIKRIQIALTIDSFLEFIGGKRIKATDRSQPQILRMFQISKEEVKKVLDENKYEEWRKISRVGIPFEDVRNFFLSRLGA